MIYILFTITIIYSIYLHFKINELEKYDIATDDVFDDLALKYDSLEKLIIERQIREYNQQQNNNIKPFPKIIKDTTEVNFNEINI